MNRLTTSHESLNSHRQQAVEQSPRCPDCNRATVTRSGNMAFCRNRACRWQGRGDEVVYDEDNLAGIWEGDE